MPYRRVILLAAAAASLVLAGCGDEENPKSDGDYVWPDGSGYPDYSSGTCAPGSCSGCCSGNTCLSGMDTTACGFSGIPCQACQTGSTCQLGICTTPKCDSTSCSTGCCDSAGKCQQGNSDTGCGTGAQTCQTCTSSEVCTNNTCTAKGPAMYKVTLVSAKVTGSSWVVCGFAELSECDLYVNLKVGNATAQSSIKTDTNNPVWNEFMLAATEAELVKKFEVEVRDDDPIGSVQIGSCTPTITTTELAAGTHTSDCGDAKQVTWSFQKI